MSIKLPAIRELTRYVSPKETEIIRYKKHNMPKSEFDGIDEFFRQDELFVRGKDKVTKGYKTYSTDDVELHYAFQMDKDIVHLNTQKRSYIDTNSPYVKMIKDGKCISTEALSGSHKNLSIDQIIDKELEKGVSENEIYNILYSSRINGIVRADFAKEAFKILDKGYPLEAVINLMDKATLKFKNGTYQYSKGMLEFLEKFPHLKQAMITKDFMGNEAFDKSGAKLFSQIYDMAPDEKTALKILRDCKTTEDDGSRHTHSSLVNLASEIIKKEGKYTDDASELIKSIKYNGSIDNHAYKAIKMLNKGIEPKYISDAIGLNISC